MWLVLQSPYRPECGYRYEEARLCLQDGSGTSPNRFLSEVCVIPPTSVCLLQSSWTSLELRPFATPAARHQSASWPYRHRSSSRWPPLDVPPPPYAAHCTETHSLTTRRRLTVSAGSLSWDVLALMSLSSLRLCYWAPGQTVSRQPARLSTWHLLPPARMEQLKLTKETAFPESPIMHLRGLQRRGAGNAHLLPLGESPAEPWQDKTCAGVPGSTAKNPRVTPASGELFFGFS